MSKKSVCADEAHDMCVQMSQICVRRGVLYPTSPHLIPCGLCPKWLFLMLKVTPSNVGVWIYAQSDYLSTLNDLCPKWLKICALSDPPAFKWLGNKQLVAFQIISSEILSVLSIFWGVFFPAKLARPVGFIPICQKRAPTVNHRRMLCDLSVTLSVCVSTFKSGEVGIPGSYFNVDGSWM